MFYLVKFSINETMNLEFEALILAFIAGAITMSLTNGGIGAYPTSYCSCHKSIRCFLRKRFSLRLDSLERTNINDCFFWNIIFYFFTYIKQIIDYV